MCVNDWWNDTDRGRQMYMERKIDAHKSSMEW